MRQRMQVGAVAVVLAGVLCLTGAHAQGSPTANGANGTAQGDAAPGGGRRGGQYAGMGRVLGEVTAVAGSTVTVKQGDGTTVQVVTTDNTRLMKDRGPVKIDDLHPGDGVMAVGNLDASAKTLHAAMLFAEDAAQVKAMRDNLGKTYITGRVTAVDLDNAKLTVQRADNVAQTIGFDETSSFKRAVRRGGRDGGDVSGAEGAGTPGASSGGPGIGSSAGFGGGPISMSAGGGIDRAFDNGESITLADIKVGDFIVGTGSVKGGVFVPTRVVDSPPAARRPRSGAPMGTPLAGPPTP